MKRNKGEIHFSSLPHLLTIEQVSQILRVHRNTLRNWDRTGRLTPIRMGARLDRRYAREDVERLYARLNMESPEDIKGVKKIHHSPSLRTMNQWVRYAVIGRRVAVYGSLIVLVIFGLQYTPLTGIVGADAENNPFGLVTLVPATCTGWEHSEMAQQLNALGTTPLEEFLETNSATFSNQVAFQIPDAESPAAVSPEPESGDTVINESADTVPADPVTPDSEVQAVPPENEAVQPAQVTDPHIVCSGYALKEPLPEGTRIETVTAAYSLGVDTFPGNEDVIDFSYSHDGKTWKQLDSFALLEDISNKTHEGYWSYPVDVTKFEDISSLQFRADYNAVPATEGSRAFLDSIALHIQVRRPPSESLSEDIAKSIHMEATDIASDDDPSIAIAVEEQSTFAFLGVEPDRRNVKVAELTDPTGKIVPVEFDIETRQEGKDTVAEYTIPKDELTKPGKYRLHLQIEQNGFLQDVVQDFSWGVIAANVRSSVIAPDTYTEIGATVLDDLGTTICHALVTVTVEHPGGTVETFSTADKTVVKNPTCKDKSVTNEADYSAFFTTTDEGQYGFEVTATTSQGTHRIHDTFVVSSAESFFIERTEFPTRIYPLASYPVAFTITATEDFSGVFTETVPATFHITEVGDGGTVVVKGRDAGTQNILWPISLRAGEKKKIAYTFDAPDISPAFYNLGPAVFGGFEEMRQWQIASDSVGAASFTRLWSSGFESQTVTADEEITATVGTAPTIDTTTFRSGVAALLTSETAGTSGATYNYAAANSNNDYYFRAYLYVTNLPETEVAIMDFRDSFPSTQTSIRMNSDGTLELWNDEDNAQQTGTSAALSLSTWYRIEFRYDATTIASTYLEARIDGVAFSSGTVNHASGGMTVRVGTLTTDTGGASTMYWDDLAINSDDSPPATQSIPENWPGPGRIVHLMPDGQPAAAASDTCAGSSASYQAVDERGAGGPDDATTIVVCDNAFDFLEVSLEDTSTQGIGANDSINLVQGGVRFTHADTSQSASFRLSTTIPGSGTSATGTLFLDSLATYRTNTSNPPRNYGLSLYGLASAAGGAISATDVDSGTLRITANDATPDVHVSTLWLLVEYEPAEGGRVWSSGFESQTVTAGEEWATVTNSPTINTTSTYLRSGSGSLRINGFSSGAAEAVAQDFVSANADGPYYGRAYLRIETAPSANNRIMSFRDSGGTDRAFIVLTSSSTLELHDEDSGGTPIGTSSALTIGTWYRVEFQINSSGAGATDTVEARVNGTNFGSSATRDLTNGITSIVVGGNLGAEAQTQGDWYFDDVAVNQNAGTTQNGYPGVGSIVYLMPNAAGDNSGFINDYTYVDEVDPDDATSYIYSGGANAITDVNVFDSSTQSIGASDTISLVSVGMRSNIGSTTAFPASVRLKDSASGTVIEGVKSNYTTTTWMSHRAAQPRIYGMTAYSRPHLTTAWTSTTLDSAQIGVRNLSTSSPIGQQLQVTTLWMLIEYVPAAGVTITGNIYTNENASPTAYDCSGNTITVRASVNGSATLQSGDCTLSTGAFSISASAPAAGGNPIAIFIDSGESISGTTITLAADTTSSISNLHIYQNRVSVTYENAGPITNANLATADTSGDAGIRYGVSTGNLTTESGMELHVWTGKTYDPGGTVTTNATGGDLHLDNNAIAYLDTATNAIGRDILVSGGATLNIDTDTTVAGGDITTEDTSAIITKSTGSPTVTLTGNGNIGGGTTPSITFYNLTIGTATAASTTATSDMAVTNTLNVDTSDSLAISSNITVTHSGTTLTLNGTISGAGRLTYKSSTAFPTSGTISSILRFDSSSNGQTLSARSYGGDVEVYGSNASNTVTAAAGTYTISGALITSQGGTGTTVTNLNTNDPNLTVNGAVTVEANTSFSSTSNTLDVKGSVTNNGTFSNNLGVVQLSGSSQQTMSGTWNAGQLASLTITNVSGSDPQTSPSVIFSSSMNVNVTFTAATANTKLRFNTGTTFFAQNIVFTGTAGNLVYLRSSSAGTAAVFQFGGGTQSVTYTDVKDSDNGSGTTITATGTGNVNSGNNTNWNFGSIRVLGTVYSDDGVTPYNCTTDGGGQLDIAVSTNGAAGVTGLCNSTGGTFVISAATLPGATDQPIVLYIASTESKKATTATLAASLYSDVSIDIYDNRVIVDSESGTTYTNTLLGTGDNTNAGIRYAVSVGNLTVESGLGLWLLTGKNFTPGGTVTTTATATAAGPAGDINIASGSTLNMAANAVSVGGDFTNSGTYTITSGQTTTF
ncbi:MAG: helix-turn-helix domain-containing protein, partial [Patescibacteria group bacterium]